MSQRNTRPKFAVKPIDLSGVSPSLILYGRLALAAVLLILGAFVFKNLIVRYILLVLSAVASGYDLGLKAFDSVLDKEYFATPIVMLFTAFVAFLIGYPTEAGRDAREFRTGSVCMITSFCSDPDTAWDLIRTFFDDSGSRDDDREDNAFRDAFYADAFPALKSEFERQAEILDTHHILTKQEPGTPYAQTSFLRRAAGSTPTAPSSGEVIFFDRALLDGVRSLLDGASCTPYVNYTPPEIEAIVLEEVSAYLGGGADADSCVKHIQSRVSIWLAEHE